ncbi:hypothetical protein ACLOJK_005564 [Asimina triloba]
MLAKDAAGDSGDEPCPRAGPEPAAVEPGRPRRCSTAAPQRPALRHPLSRQTASTARGRAPPRLPQGSATRCTPPAGPADSTAAQQRRDPAPERRRPPDRHWKQRSPTRRNPACNRDIAAGVGGGRRGFGTLGDRDSMPGWRGRRIEIALDRRLGRLVAAVAAVVVAAVVVVVVAAAAAVAAGVAGIGREAAAALLREMLRNPWWEEEGRKEGRKTRLGRDLQESMLLGYPATTCLLRRVLLWRCRDFSSPSADPSVASSRCLHSAAALIFNEEWYGYESHPCSLYRHLCPSLSIYQSLLIMSAFPG